MAIGSRVESEQFPYLPLTLIFGGRSVDLLALLDTGFDGDVSVSPELLGYDDLPDVLIPYGLGDDSRVPAPAYRGAIRLGGLAPIDVEITALGSEPVVGTGVISRYRVLLDHGERVILEP